MSKDPAVLFYYQDFLVGTEFLTDDEVGKYIRILCHQADKGKLTKKQVLSICKASVIPNFIQEKLKVDSDGFFYNQRMLEEKQKRQKFSESRRNNAKGVKAYAQHMEDEDEDININKKEDKNVNEIKIVQKEYFVDMLPIDSTQQFIEAWNEWCDFRREIKKKLTKLSAKKQISFLLNQPDPIKPINQSIQNGWTGLFEVSAKSNLAIIRNEYTYNELNEMSSKMSKPERITFWNKYEILPNKKWKLK